jgi:predicted mannosyl-3-phosphoglycerate phosphatase (HAD superfamily)
MRTQLRTAGKSLTVNHGKPFHLLLAHSRRKGKKRAQNLLETMITCRSVKDLTCGVGDTFVGKSITGSPDFIVQL